MSTSWLRAKNQLTQNIHFDEYTMVKVGQGLSPTLKSFLVAKATLEIAGHGQSVIHTFQYHHYEVKSKSK